MRPDRVLQGYRLAFSALILIASVQTLLGGPRDPHHVVVASVEAAGALMFMSGRTQLAGAVALLFTFLLAQGIAVAKGYWHTQYLQYVASTVLILLLGRRPPADNQGSLKDQ